MAPLLWPMILLSSAQAVLLIVGAALIIRLSRRLCGERRINATVILKTLLLNQRRAERLRREQEEQEQAALVAQTLQLQLQQQQQQQQVIALGWRGNASAPAAAPAAAVVQSPASPSPPPVSGLAAGNINGNDAPMSNSVVLSNSAFDRFTFALLSMLPIVTTFCATGMWLAYVMRVDAAYWVGSIPFLHALAILAASMYSR